MDWTRNFKRPSVQKWQCLINNGTIEGFFVINDVQDIVVFLGLTVFYSDMRE